MASERREPVTGDADPDDEGGTVDIEEQLERLDQALGQHELDEDEEDDEAEPISACRWCEAPFTTLTGERTHECEGRQAAAERWHDTDPASTPDDIADTVAPQVHELNAHLLFAPLDDDPDQDGLYPYHLLKQRWEPDLECRFQAAGTDWVFASEDSFEAAEIYPDAYDHRNANVWEGNIATRPGDAGDAYYEFTAPLVDADDPNLNRRVTLTIRPRFDGAETPDGEPIDSLQGCPTGVGIEVSSSSVARKDIIKVIQGFASALGIRSDWFAPEEIHERSRITGLAYYVRVMRDVVDDLVVGEEGLLERLAQFTSRRQGRGEFKWDNRDVEGNRTAVSLDPGGLGSLYGTHHVGKLLKSYLLKSPREDARDPEDHPTDHPKIEVQWSREYTPYDVSVPWRAADAEGIAPDELAANLKEYLVNALQWAGINRRPDAEHWVPDDHFAPVAMAPGQRSRIEIVGDPIDLQVEHERSLATKRLLEDPPTETQQDILDALADHGGFDDQAALADAADASTSSVSRTFRKYEALVSTMDRLSFADSVVRERVQELMATLERDLDGIQRGIECLLTSMDEDVPEDSPFGKWVTRYGATLRNSRRDGLQIELATGNLTRHELVQVLRAGFEAADATGAIDVRKFAFARVAYHNKEGEKVDRNDRIVVNNAVESEILGKVPVGQRV